MKVTTNTTHDLSITNDEFEVFVSATVDSDKTVRLKMPGAADPDKSSWIHTLWLDRNDLLALRALVNKALQYVE